MRGRSPPPESKPKGNHPASDQPSHARLATTSPAQGATTNSNPLGGGFASRATTSTHRSHEETRERSSRQSASAGGLTVTTTGSNHSGSLVAVAGLWLAAVPGVDCCEALAAAAASVSISITPSICLISLSTRAWRVVSRAETEPRLVKLPSTRNGRFLWRFRCRASRLRVDAS